MSDKIPLFAGEKKRIRLICPICNKIGSIVVERSFLGDVIRDKDEWMMELQVFPGDVCEHEFTIRVDANLKAR